MICLGNEPIEKIGPPQPPYPPTNHMQLANFHNFYPIWTKLGMEVNFEGIRIKWADGGAGPIFRPPQLIPGTWAQKKSIFFYDIFKALAMCMDPIQNVSWQSGPIWPKKTPRMAQKTGQNRSKLWFFTIFF